MEMNTRLVGLLVALLMTTGWAPRAGDEFHFALARSMPAADAAVPAPSEIRLWFTQVPKPGSLTVRLVNARGDLVQTESPKADETDPKVISLAIRRSIPVGRYTVAWRGVGDDGHVVQGEFGFSVVAE